MKSVDYAANEAKEHLSKVTEWEENTGNFPKPALIENKIYPVKDLVGHRFYAEFCFGGGEYWWLSTQDSREVGVAEFSRKTL